MVLKRPQGGTSQKEAKASDNRKTRTYQDHDADRMYQAIEDKQASVWSATFLPSVGVILLALGIALVILGSVRGQGDLILLGVIFMAGGVLFFGIMYTAVCRPFCHRNQVENYTYIENVQQTDIPKRPMSEPPDYPSNQHMDVDYKRAKFQPRDSALYSNISRSFLASPATTKDVNFEDGLETPPPPRVALAKETEFTVTHDDDDEDGDDHIPSTPEFLGPVPGPAEYESETGTKKQLKDTATLL